MEFNMKKLEGKIVIIPDIHQCLGFANRVLEAQPDAEHYVFLGDYIDCFERPDNKEYFSVRWTCDWLNNKFNELGNRATWLLGNHDLAYLATYKPYTYQLHNPDGKFYCCSGWTKNKASTFNQYIDPEFVKSLELCVEAGGFVCSHAGFHHSHFQPLSSEIDNIRRLSKEWRNTGLSFRIRPFHWIGQVGSCRGGIDDFSSPVWLDWDGEFEPLDSVRQIVGHTNGENVRSKILKNNKKDYCIDAYRSVYAILNESSIKFYNI
jgi:predicted phosphodiesterase